MPQAHLDGAASTQFKGVHQRVGDQLVDDQGKGNSLLQAQQRGLDLDREGYLRSAVRPRQLGAEVVDECADVEPGKILLPVQGPIDKPDRLEPVAVLEELLPGCTIGCFAHLQPGQADRNLNAVTDAVVQFLDQDLPAFQQLLQLLLGAHADGDLAGQFRNLLVQYRERLV